MASDQSLYCLLSGFPIENTKKRQNRSDTPKMTSELFLLISVEESSSIQWVNHSMAFSQRIIGEDENSDKTQKNAHFIKAYTACKGRFL